MPCEIAACDIGISLCCAVDGTSGLSAGCYLRCAAQMLVGGTSGKEPPRRPRTVVARMQKVVIAKGLVACITVAV